MRSAAHGLLSVLALSTLALASEQQASAPAALYLRAGTVNTSATPGIPLAEAARGATAADRFVIQLDGPITPERRARLAAAGVGLKDYLPDCAYIATLHGANGAALAGVNFVRWVSPYQTAWKVDPEVGKRAYLTAERRQLVAAGRDRLVVVVFAGADVGAAEKAVFGTGAAITGEEPMGDHMELFVTAPLGGVNALAAIPGVQFIEPAPEIEARNVTTRWIVQSNIAGQTPLYANGLHGEGQVLGHLDDGFRSSHCSFSDTNPIGPTHRKILAINGAVTSTTHGTHTAGIAVGDAGSDTAETRGIAYLGKMVTAHWPAFTEVGMNTALSLHHSQGGRLHTNSWGDDGTTAYNGLCRGIDLFQYNNEDSLVLFAVTNQSLLKNPENAKNLLAVGATNNSPGQSSICYGGAGPTSDQRRKPEIFAPGCDIQSANSATTCGTTALSGTSMACPAVTGTGMLVRQYFTDGYYPSGAPGGTPITPSAALIKATLLNSAVDMTGTSGYPTNAEGWGRVLADNSLYFPGDARKLLISDVRNAQGLVTGGQDVVNVNVLGSSQPVHITLVFTEPPAAAGAANAVVNDLDLEVVDAASNTYLGNVFNTAAGVSVTGGAKDPRNNVEQVIINNPPAGAWTVRVKGGNVAVGTQGYALVVTGDIQSGTAPPLLISLPAGAPSLIAPGATTDIDVRIQNGSQVLVPGSAAMSYRLTGSGGFSTIPLTALGGEMFRGTLPAPTCADTPQFYFSAQGDGGATVSLPANAPATTLSAAVGTTSTTDVLDVDFATGILPPGWTAGGLWHLGSLCAPGGACNAAPFLYYGQDSTCTFQTGAANSGNVTSAPVALPAVPAGGSVTLSYCSAKVSENSPEWDIATVLVNGTVVDTVPDSSTWETRTVDLTSYAGQTVTLTWRFDTVDGTLNDFRGWHVDGIHISATGTSCTNPPSCYANCDGSTIAPILNVLDFNCFLNRFAAGDSYANCDGSTIAPVLNVLDFNCFLNRFAAGCP